MAVNTVSTVTYDNWQTISTLATTSGTSVTFSSISGYKRFMVALTGVGNTTSDYLILQFNSTTSGYASFAGYNTAFAYQATNTGIALNGNTDTTISGVCYIENVLASAPKTTTGTFFGNASGAGYTAQGAWINTSAITSITVKGLSGYAFNAGSVTLYGIAA